MEMLYKLHGSILKVLFDEGIKAVQVLFFPGQVTDSLVVALLYVVNG